MAVVRFDATDVGRRVTLRRLDPDGSGGMSDVVGTLESWSEGRLRVRRRTGQVVEVLQGSLVAGRVVAPEVSAVALQERCAADWTPAESPALNGWTLRHHHGVNRRSCSALALALPDAPLAEQIATVRAWYAERSSPALILSIEGSPVDSALADLPVVLRNDVLVATTADVIASAPQPDGLSFRLENEPSPEFVAMNSETPLLAQHVQALLATAPRARYATGTDPEGDVAMGRVSPRDGWAGVTHIDVAAHARRRGLGSALMGVLARAASEAGADHVWLQVERDNLAAQRLYTGLGFTRHHGYLYRDAS